MSNGRATGRYNNIGQAQRNMMRCYDLKVEFLFGSSESNSTEYWHHHHHHHHLRVCARTIEHKYFCCNCWGSLCQSWDQSNPFQQRSYVCQCHQQHHYYHHH